MGCRWISNARAVCTCEPFPNELTYKVRSGVGGSSQLALRSPCKPAQVLACSKFCGFPCGASGISLSLSPPPVGSPQTMHFAPSRQSAPLHLSGLRPWAQYHPVPFQMPTYDGLLPRVGTKYLSPTTRSAFGGAGGITSPPDTSKSNCATLLRSPSFQERKCSGQLTALDEIKVVSKILGLLEKFSCVSDTDYGVQHGRRQTGAIHGRDCSLVECRSHFPPDLLGFRVDRFRFRHPLTGGDTRASHRYA